MRVLAWLALAFVLFLAAVTILRADDRVADKFEDGYLQYQGDPYWYKGETPYTREKLTYVENVQKGYYSHPQTYYYYKYFPAYPQQTKYDPPKYTPPPYAPGWQEKALEIARKRDEYDAYLKALDAMGFKGQYWDPNGYHKLTLPLPAAMARSTYLGAHGVQGNTTYGYSLNSVKELYGNTDLNTLYQQSARLVQGAQQLASQGNSDFSTLVGNAGQNAARVAEILARAQAASIALNASNPQDSQRSSVSLSVSGAIPPGAVVPFPGAVTPQPPPGIMPRAEVGDFMRNVAIPQCAGCHSGKNLKGNFDINSYPSMPLEEKASRVWSRVFTLDRDKVMPRNADGSPGSMTTEQKKAFVLN